MPWGHRVSLPRSCLRCQKDMVPLPDEPVKECQVVCELPCQCVDDTTSPKRRIHCRHCDFIYVPGSKSRAYSHTKSALCLLHQLVHKAWDLTASQARDQILAITPRNKRLLCETDLPQDERLRLEIEWLESTVNDGQTPKDVPLRRLHPSFVPDPDELLEQPHNEVTGGGDRTVEADAEYDGEMMQDGLEFLVDPDESFGSSTQQENSPPSNDEEQRPGTKSGEQHANGQEHTDCALSSSPPSELVPVGVVETVDDAVSGEDATVLAANSHWNVREASPSIAEQLFSICGDVDGADQLEGGSSILQQPPEQETDWVGGWPEPIWEAGNKRAHHLAIDTNAPTFGYSIESSEQGGVDSQCPVMPQRRRLGLPPPENLAAAQPGALERESPDDGPTDSIRSSSGGGDCKDSEPKPSSDSKPDSPWSWADVAFLAGLLDTLRLSGSSSATTSDSGTGPNRQGQAAAYSRQTVLLPQPAFEVSTEEEERESPPAARSRILWQVTTETDDLPPPPSERVASRFLPAQLVLDEEPESLPAPPAQEPQMPPDASTSVASMRNVVV